MEVREIINTSQRVTFKRCRQRFFWAYMEGWTPKTPSPALRFGDLVHRSLAAYYQPGLRRGPHPAETFEKLYQKEMTFASGFKVKDIDMDKWTEAGDLGLAVLNNYVATYGKDEHIKVIAPEHPFKINLRDAAGKPITYVGRFDAIIEFRKTGEIGLFEHKTASSISDAFLSLDEQAGTYWAFGTKYLRKKGILKPDHDLEMILYNFLRKAKPDERPRNDKGQHLNKDGSISKTQPPPYFERIPVYRDDPDSRNIIRRIRNESWEMRLVRAGKLPIYKNPGPDTCGGRMPCAFRDVCELHETGSDYQEVLNQNFYQRDPMAEYKEELGLTKKKKGGK